MPVIISNAPTKHKTHKLLQTELILSIPPILYSLIVLISAGRTSRIECIVNPVMSKCLTNKLVVNFIIKNTYM